VYYRIYISVAKDSINFQLHTISAQNYTTKLLLHKWITLYDVLLLSFLLLLLYTTTYTIIYPQVCASEMYDHFMILYSKLTTVRESGASKNGEIFLFFCVFFEKKKDELLFFDYCMSFF
jgi:hypothetical protein